MTFVSSVLGERDERRVAVDAKLIMSNNVLANGLKKWSPHSPLETDSLAQSLSDATDAHVQEHIIEVDSVDAGFIPCGTFLVFEPSCDGCLSDAGCAWVTKQKVPRDDLGRVPGDFNKDLSTLYNYERRAERAAKAAINDKDHGECMAHDANKFKGHYVAVINTSQSHLGDGEVRLTNPANAKDPVVCKSLSDRIQKDLVEHPWVARKERGNMTMTTLETAVEKCKNDMKDPYFEKKHLLRSAELTHVIIDAPFNDQHADGKRKDAQIVQALMGIKPLRWGSDQGDHVDPISMVIAASENGNLAAIYINGGRHRAVAARNGHWDEIPVTFHCNADPGQTLNIPTRASEAIAQNPSSQLWIPFDFALETINKPTAQRTREACVKSGKCR